MLRKAVLASGGDSGLRGAFRQSPRLQPGTLFVRMAVNGGHKKHPKVLSLSSGRLHVVQLTLHKYWRGHVILSRA